MRLNRRDFDYESGLTTPVIFCYYYLDTLSWANAPEDGEQKTEDRKSVLCHPTPVV